MIQIITLKRKGIVTKLIRRSIFVGYPTNSRHLSSVQDNNAGESATA